jgi:hypothetical protein
MTRKSICLFGLLIAGLLEGAFLAFDLHRDLAKPSYILLCMATCFAMPPAPPQVTEPMASPMPPIPSRKRLDLPRGSTSLFGGWSVGHLQH